MPADAGQLGLEEAAAGGGVRVREQERLVVGLGAAQAVAAHERGREIDFDPHQPVRMERRQGQALAKHRDVCGIVATTQIDDGAGRDLPQVDVAGGW